MIHVTTDQHDTWIGDHVTVGHGAVLHGCRLESGSFVGMRATVMDGAVVEPGHSLPREHLFPREWLFLRDNWPWGHPPVSFGPSGKQKLVVAVRSLLRGPRGHAEMCSEPGNTTD